MSTAGSWQYAGKLDRPRKPKNPIISAGNQKELAEANLRVKKILRAGKVAMMNGYIFGFFAVITLAYAQLSLLLGTVDVATLLIGACLTVFAYNEFYGRRLIRQFDPNGASRLGWNQLAVIGIMMLYCGWSLYSGMTGIDDELRNLQSMGGGELEISEVIRANSGYSLKELYVYLYLGTYGLVALMTLLFQGGNAIYYFTRRRLIERYLNETPGWIVDVQRSGLIA